MNVHLALEEAQKAWPNQRVGQLISNALDRQYEERHSSNLFYIKDNDLAEILLEYARSS